MISLVNIEKRSNFEKTERENVKKKRIKISEQF